MTKIDNPQYECDSCGGIYDGSSDFIKQCSHCQDDFCEECQEEHAKDECGF